MEVEVEPDQPGEEHASACSLCRTEV